jgi:hypothetical protein
MRAIDALGIAAMLGADISITSPDPGTGEPVTVTVPGGPEHGSAASYRLVLQ